MLNFSKIAKLEGHLDAVTGISLNTSEEFLASCSKDRFILF